MAHTPYEVRLFTDPETLSTVVLESDYAELKAINTELLKALTGLVESVEHWRVLQKLNALWLRSSLNRARAAIAKATPEAPNVPSS